MKRMSFLLQLFLASTLIFGVAKAQTKPVPPLKNSLAYNRNQSKTFPDFTYESKDSAPLVHLREKYNLDEVAGKGSDVERAIKLLAWFHDQVPHGDVGNLDTLTAENIIDTYKTKKVPQGCYPLAISVNEIFLAMGYTSRVVICFSGKYPEPNGGHVITSVYMPSLKKWIYMDPQDNAYIKDEKGNFLSIAEVRERLIDGRPLILNETANYHNIPSKKEDYLYTFMMEHMYRMISPLNSSFSSETRSKGKTLEYVELLPAGSKDPSVDGYETSARKNYNVISYHTNNDLIFWAAPKP